MSTKIITVGVENFKRVKLAKVEVRESGLTVIGGNNAAGKTSVLDAIVFALGGERYRPSSVTRNGSETPAEVTVKLSNGLTVSRKGKNASLTVTDPAGMKAGQKLLDGFIDALALDLPRFMAASDKERAATLLKVIGVGDQLASIEAAEKSIYEQRTEQGRQADQAAKHAAALPQYPEAPAEVVSVAELARKRQEIADRNEKNRRSWEELQRVYEAKAATLDRVNELRAKLANEEAALAELETRAEKGAAYCAALTDGYTGEIDRQIETAETVNAQVRANAERKRAQADADKKAADRDKLTAALEAKRAEKAALLESAALPLPELTVEGGALRYRGQAWDCMSGAEQLRVSAAIVRRLKPECGFVLLDKLEQFDLATLKEFGEWAEAQDLQLIGTRVSTGAECSIIIEDGTAATDERRR